MSKEGDLRDDVVARLRQVRERLGPDVYRAAARAALHDIAIAVLDETERRAGVDRLSGVILRFPQGLLREKSANSPHDAKPDRYDPSAAPGRRRRPFGPMARR
jgi:hypothetical protein